MTFVEFHLKLFMFGIVNILRLFRFEIKNESYLLLLNRDKKKNGLAFMVFMLRETRYRTVSTRAIDPNFEYYLRTFSYYRKFMMVPNDSNVLTFKFQ